MTGYPNPAMAKEEPEAKEEPKAKEEPETKDEPVTPSNSPGRTSGLGPARRTLKSHLLNGLQNPR